MNGELVHLLVRIMLMTLGLMAVIMLCCIATPHLARWIDKRRPQKPQEENTLPENMPDVRGAFDASHEDDYDLNYKIYNKDIYGVDFKNGKEKNG